MHKLVRDLINDQIPEAEKKQLIEKAIQVVAEPFAGQMDIFTNRIVETPEHLMQAQALSEQAQKIYYHSIPLFSLRIRMLASFMSGFRDFETARHFVSIVLGGQEKLQMQSLPGTSGVLSSTIDGLSLTDQAFFENNLGYLELMSRNYEKALKHYKRSFEAQKKTLGALECCRDLLCYRRSTEGGANDRRREKASPVFSM